MRQVVIAALASAMLAGQAAAQTPDAGVPPADAPPSTTPPSTTPSQTPSQTGPTPTPAPTGPTPTPVPVPVQPSGPTPVPVPAQPTGPTPTPVPVPIPSQIEPKPVAPKPEPPKPSPMFDDGEQTIRAIVVEDNTKTTDATVELISQLSIGDPWSPHMVDVVKSRLVSSGLFKDVVVYWTKTHGGVTVHILAKDKHSWVIAPAFYNQPTNVGGGVGFGENNLFGENQKLLLYGQIATGDSFFIGAWVVPSIAGSRFYSQLDTYLKSARNIEYAAPSSYMIGNGDVKPVRESRIYYYNFGGTLGVELTRGLKFDARLRGAKVRYGDIKIVDGATIDDIEPGGDPTAPPKPGAEGWDVSNELRLSLDKRANWYGVQTGYKYGITFEHALPSLGSDFRYYYGSLGGWRGYQVLERHNLVLKGNVAMGRDLPFQQEFLTGGTSMRGWLNNQFRGDFRALTNAEYSVPFLSIKGFSVRGLAFVDAAYTTFIRTTNMQRHYLPHSSVRGLDGLKTSVGVGTRFYLRQIVLPLLGLDFGYGLEARDFQVYLAIGLTD